MDPIDSLLTRGVANIIPSKEALEKVLRSDKKLNIYLGVDPTAVHLHLGNATHLRKLQQFVDLGHHITFLIGDFTALIGDTSDKDTERPVLTYQQIEENFATYKSQAEKLLDFSKVTLRHNSEWLKKLTFEDILKLTRHFTLNDFISRELIKKRLTDGKSVSLPEILYPIMQGYDSWFMDTDLQIGGTDQTFNMQAGRTLQKNLRSKESFVLAGEFLEGTDGRKMSKSWGNAIWLDDEPNDMFGKVMSLKDELIPHYFELATNLSELQISNFKLQITNPMDLKKQLAWQIISELHTSEAADSAKAHFETVFQNREIPENIPLFSSKSTNIVDVLSELPEISSKTRAKTLIDQNAVEINGVRIKNYDFVLHQDDKIRAGKLMLRVVFK